MAEPISRREFLKKAGKALVVGAVASNIPYYGANAAMSFTKKKPTLDKIEITPIKGKFPEGIVTVDKISINGRNVHLIGCQHNEKYVGAHSKFIKELVKRNKAEVVGLETSVFRHGGDVFKQEGYAASLANSLKGEVDVADVEGRHLSMQSIVANMFRDLVTNVVSITYPLYAILSGFMKNKTDAKSLAFFPAAFLSMVRGGVSDPDAPLKLLPEIGFEHTVGGLKRNGENVEAYWLRHPTMLLSADAFFAKSMRQLSERYENVLIVVGAYHVPGTIKCLKEGIEPAAKFTMKDDFVVYKKDGTTETIKID